MADFICIAEFISKENKSNELRAELSKLVAPTLQEAGCLSYALHRSVECEKTYTMIERFKSKADFDFHSNQNYLKQFIDLIPVLVESVNVSVCETV